MRSPHYATAWRALTKAIGGLVEKTIFSPACPVSPEERASLGAEALSSAYLSFLASIGLSNARIAERLRAMASEVESGEAQASATAMIRAASGPKGGAS